MAEKSDKKWGGLMKKGSAHARLDTYYLGHLDNTTTHSGNNEPTTDEGPGTNWTSRGPTYQGARAKDSGKAHDD